MSATSPILTLLVRYLLITERLPTRTVMATVVAMAGYCIHSKPRLFPVDQRLSTNQRRETASEQNRNKNKTQAFCAILSSQALPSSQIQTQSNVYERSLHFPVTKNDGNQHNRYSPMRNRCFRLHRHFYRHRHQRYQRLR